MAGKTAILSVRVISDTKDAQRGAAETANAWEKFEKRLDQATIVAGAAGAGLVKLGMDAYKAASDLQQSTGGVESVFKDQSKAITSFAETAWESVGLSQNKAQEMATLIGSQLKNLGVPMEEVAGMTIDLTKTAADLAATFGGPTSDAVAAISSLLKGERNPIERYGVTINETMVKAKALSMGLVEATTNADKIQAASMRADAAQQNYNKALEKYGDGSTQALTANASLISAQSALETAMEGSLGEMTAQQKQQATLALLYEQTTDATGKFAAEADTAAGAAERNRARWETVQAQLGTKLLPIMTTISTALIDLAGWVEKNSDMVLTFAGVIGGAVVAVVGLNAAIKTARVVSTVFTGITSAGSATVGVIGRFVGGMRNAAVAQSTFSGAAGTLGGKVTQLVTAMGKGTVAAAKWAVQTTVLTAKLVAQKVAQLAIAAASRAAAVAQGIWNVVMNANPIILIITLIIGAIILLVMNWETVQAVAVAVWDAITTAAVWFWDNVLVPIGDFIVGVFVTAWTNLQNAASAVWNAIATAARWFWDNVLVPIGQFIAAVFVGYWTMLKVAALAVWAGIRGAGETLWNWLKSLGQWIGSTLGAAWTGMKKMAANAINAIVWPIQTLINWIKTAVDWVGKLFSSGIGKVGDLLGFSAAPQERGAPVTAASGSAPALAWLPQLVGRSGSGDQTVNVTVSLPNYVGNRQELERWLREALRSIKIKNDRIVTV